MPILLAPMYDDDMMTVSLKCAKTLHANNAYDAEQWIK